MKVTIHKVSGDGETLIIEEEFITPEEINKAHEKMAVAFRLADDRLMEINLRIMTMRFFNQSMKPETQMELHTLMEVLHGAQLSDPSYRGILLEAIEKVTQSLVEKGYDRKRLDKLMDNNFGNGARKAPGPQLVKTGEEH